MAQNAKRAGTKYRPVNRGTRRVIPVARFPRLTVPRGKQEPRRFAKVPPCAQLKILVARHAEDLEILVQLEIVLAIFALCIINFEDASAFGFLFVFTAAAAPS